MSEGKGKIIEKDANNKRRGKRSKSKNLASKHSPVLESLDSNSEIFPGMSLSGDCVEVRKDGAHGGETVTMSSPRRDTPWPVTNANGQQLVTNANGAPAYGQVALESPSKGHRRRLSIPKFEGTPTSNSNNTGSLPPQEWVIQPPFSIAPTSAEVVFDVRSTGYARSKVKIPSIMPPLYEIKGAVCFNTNERVDSAVDVCKEMWADRSNVDEDVAEWLKNEFGLKDAAADGHAGESLRDPSIPPIIVVHWQLPYSNSGFLGRKKEDGGQIGFFFEAGPDFVSETNELYERGSHGDDEKGSLTGNAGKLLRNWLRNASEDFALRSRFKAIMKVHNLDNIGLGTFGKYNGKPVLIKKTGALTTGTLPSGRKYVEMRCNVHGWGLMSRRGFVHVVPKLKEMIMHVGFVIEGRDDDELPERLLGSAALRQLDPNMVVNL